MECVVRYVCLTVSSPPPPPPPSYLVAPEVINISQDQLTVSPDPVVMFCEATGYPRPTIAWFFNGAHVTVNEKVTIDTAVSPLENTTLGLGRVTSYLRLSVTHPSDAGVYECVSSNLLGRATDRTNLSVHCECVHMSTGALAIPQVKSGQPVTEYRLSDHMHLLNICTYQIRIQSPGEVVSACTFCCCLLSSNI